MGDLTTQKSTHYRESITITSLHTRRILLTFPEKIIKDVEVIVVLLPT